MTQRTPYRKKIPKADIDRGWSWVVAAACSFMHVAIYGIYGIYGQLFVATYKALPSSREQASFPFTLSCALQGFSGPIVGYLGHKFGVRPVALVGCIIGALGSALCYFATNVQWIIVFWGIVFGFGFGLSTSLLPLAINQYFLKYRATASGISFTGTCVGSMILPPIVDLLLDNYGLPGTFLMLAGLILNCVPATMLLRTPIVSGNESLDSRVLSDKQSPGKYTENEVYSIPLADVSVMSNHSVPQGEDICHFERYGTALRFNPECEKQFQMNIISSTTRNSTHCYPVCRFSDQHKIIIQEVQESKSTYCVTTSNLQKEQYVNMADHSGYKQKITPDLLSQASVEEESNFFKLMLRLCSTPMFILITVSFGVYCYSILCVITAVVDFAQDVGVEYSRTKYLLIVLSIGDMTGRMGIGWVTDAGYLTTSATTCSSFMLLGITTAVIGFMSSFWTLVASLYAYGICRGGVLIIYPLLVSQYVDKNMQAIAMATSQVLVGPASLVVTPTIGTAMASRDRDRGRKYLSGAEKLKRKKQRDNYIKKQTNNILKYVTETTSHSRQPNEGEEHTAMNQIALEKESQELNTPVKKENGRHQRN